MRHPDRIALWAVGIAVVGMIAAAASAHGASGGGTDTSSCTGVRRTVGVAHRHLPCGTKVTLKYGDRYVTARVIDRGPYTEGVRWDLTMRAATELHFTQTDDIRAASIKE